MLQTRGPVGAQCFRRGDQSEPSAVWSPLDAGADPNRFPMGSIPPTHCTKQDRPESATGFGNYTREAPTFSAATRSIWENDEFHPPVTRSSSILNGPSPFLWIHQNRRNVVFSQPIRNKTSKLRKSEKDTESEGNFSWEERSFTAIYVMVCSCVQKPIYVAACATTT